MNKNITKPEQNYINCPCKKRNLKKGETYGRYLNLHNKGKMDNERTFKKYIQNPGIGY